MKTDSRTHPTCCGVQGNGSAYQITNGAFLASGVSAGHTRTARSTPLVDLNVWSVKPGGAEGGCDMIFSSDIGELDVVVIAQEQLESSVQKKSQMRTQDEEDALLRMLTRTCYLSEVPQAEKR